MMDVGDVEWTPPDNWPVYLMGRFDCRCGFTTIGRPDVRTAECGSCHKSAPRVLVAAVPCPPISPTLRVENLRRARYRVG